MKSQITIPREVQENLQYIELFTKKKIRNLLVGNYTSVLVGHGYDFVDHKKYQAGDDIRKIDWNAMARTGYPLIKNTHEERDVDVFIAADLSRSMSFATGELSKKELLLYITATLAYSALSDHIRIGFIGFTDQVEMEIEARKGKAHLWMMLNELWDFQPRHAKTNFLPALERLRQRLKRMSIIFLISDFFFDQNIFEEIVFKHIISRHDLIPILLNDPIEAIMPEGRGYLRLWDLESGKKRNIRLNSKNRLLYLQFLRDRHRELISRFYQYSLDFQEIQTDQSFYELIMTLFLMRKRP
ncbi:MAG: DUF58 domain-containing protein [Acidobacteria bacterium]|nr:DUF58 domain-containing protein [Acidobacteriota bacterium]